MTIKIIVGEDVRGVTVWTLPDGITLNAYPDTETVFIIRGGKHLGELTRRYASELFNVLLYPPGSVPSPESEDPTDRARMRLEKERQWDIPRKDLENGDWN